MKNGDGLSDFEHGVLVGGSTGLALVGAIYIFLAPTSDIRARIPFLLEATGGVLGVACIVAFWLVGAGTLLAQGRHLRATLVGVLVP